MALVIGNNISISLDGTDYTQYILEYSESGGSKVIKNQKTFGNNYITTIVGREDYELTLKFKYDTTLNFDILYEDNTSISIDVELDTKTISYINAYAKSYTFDIVNDDIVYLEITYLIASADTNTYNKEVI